MNGHNGAVLPELPDEVDRELWKDTYGIAYIGAANPRAVASTMSKWMTTLSQDHGYGTRQLESHPALRNMAGQLSFLFGQSLGQTPEDLEVLAEKVKHYGFGTS